MLAAMSLGQRSFPASGEDIDVLARTVWGEARGETLSGQIAVAWTIRHRAEIAAAWCAKHPGQWHPHYGDGSLARVCQARRQYDCWDADDPNLAKLKTVTLDDAAFKQAMYVALGVVHGDLDDALPTSTHYLNPRTVTHLPAWVTGVPPKNGQPAIPPARKVGRIGHHDFYDQVAA